MPSVAKICEVNELSYEKDKVGIKPIWQRFLLKNQLFSLDFKEGFVFARVIRRRICHYKPWNLIDSNGDAVDIGEDSHAGPYRFRDPRNTANDILFLETSTNQGYPWLLHGGIGIRPQQILMYPRYPEGKTIPGKFPNLDPIKPSSGEYLGYVASQQSPFEQPTDYIEYVIPPHQRIAAEYYNQDDDRDHQPVLHLLFAVYWFQILTLDTHPELVGKIAERRVPSTFLTVGFGDAPESLGQLTSENWGLGSKYEKVLSLDEAARGGR